MEKNTIIAVVLSIFVLLAWQFFFTPAPQPQAPSVAPAVANALTQPSVQNAVSASSIPVAPGGAVSMEEKSVKVETDLYTAEFSTKGGIIKKFQLKRYKDNDGVSVSLLNGRGAIPALAVGFGGDFSSAEDNYSLTGGDLKLSGAEAGTLVLEHSSPKYSIRRTYSFKGDAYQFELKDEVSGAGGYELALGTDFGLSTKVEESGTHLGPVVLADTTRHELTSKKLTESKSYSGAIKWVAREDKYFFAAIAPKGKAEEARAWLAGGADSVSLKSPSGGSFLIYAGPKEHDSLKALGVGLEHIVDFGFFSIIARPLFWILKMLYSLVHNWGWAIVMLTIVARVPFIPIVNKGQRAMKRLQEVQPRMQEIREKYKKDPQRMQAEMTELYKKHKVNPVSGCLPMLLQIPVFFALYKVLMVAIELRGAPFMLWITDLSVKDPYYVLPIIMGVTMLVQQKMTPSAGDPTQQKIMMIMPIVFTFLFLGFASGLVLYWLVNNVLAIAQQMYVNAKDGKTAPAS